MISVTNAAAYELRVPEPAASTISAAVVSSSYGIGCWIYNIMSASMVPGVLFQFIVQGPTVLALTVVAQNLYILNNFEDSLVVPAGRGWSFMSVRRTDATTASIYLNDA